METKKWTIKTLEDKKFNFYPVFISDTQGTVKCERVIMKEGENKYTFNFLDLLMFVYFVGDEEQRQKLLNVQSKIIKEIPYDVTFKIDKMEKETGIAKRRIMLPLDGVIAAYCRDEAKKIVFKKALQHKL